MIPEKRVIDGGDESNEVTGFKYQEPSYLELDLNTMCIPPEARGNRKDSTPWMPFDSMNRV